MEPMAPVWGVIALVIGLVLWFGLAWLGVCCCMLASRITRRVEKWRGHD